MPPTTPARPFLPLVPGPWLPLERDEQLAFGQRLDAHLRAGGLSEPSFTRQCPLQWVHAVPLSFYPGWLLLTAQVQLPDEEVANVDVLMGPGFFWCLDGVSAMIHDINGGEVRLPVPGPDPAARRDMPSPLAPLLPRGTGPDYLHFFCHAVRGDQGCFRIVQSAEDLRHSGVTDDVERLAARLEPLRASWKRGSGSGSGTARAVGATAESSPRDLRVVTPMLYGGTLFRASFELRPGGMVRMIDDDAIAHDVAPAERTRQWLRAIRPARPGAEPGGRSA